MFAKVVSLTVMTWVLTAFVWLIPILGKLALGIFCCVFPVGMISVGAFTSCWVNTTKIGIGKSSPFIQIPAKLLTYGAFFCFALFTGKIARLLITFDGGQRVPLATWNPIYGGLLSLFVLGIVVMESYLIWMNFKEKGQGYRLT